VKCSLIDEYVKKRGAHGMSTFNGSIVLSNMRPTLRSYTISIVHAKFYSPKGKIPFLVNLFVYSSSSYVIIDQKNYGDEIFNLIAQTCCLHVCTIKSIESITNIF
jgi:hypothetical protein